MSCGAPPPRRPHRGVRIVALAGLVASAGCWPIVAHRYYEPAAAEGAKPRNPCWKTFETLVVERGAATFAVRVVPTGDTRSVEIAVGVPAGHRVDVESSAIGVFAEDGERLASLPLAGISPIRSANARTRALREPMRGDTFAKDVVRHYWIYAPLAVDDRTRFTLVMPAFAIDGVPRELPPIDFARTTRWQFFAPLQC